MGLLDILTMQPFDLGCMQFSIESQHWVISTGEYFLERCHGQAISLAGLLASKLSIR